MERRLITNLRKSTTQKINIGDVATEWLHDVDQIAKTIDRSMPEQLNYIRRPDRWSTRTNEQQNEQKHVQIR